MGQEKAITANEFVNVRDIKGNLLYTRDGYMFGYIQLGRLNLDLLADAEKQALTRRLSISFEDDRKDFTYMSYPRELDLDAYKGFLKEKRRQEMTDLGRRKILEEMLIDANEISSSGENYEHQHYIKLWALYDPQLRNCERDFQERLQSFCMKYVSCGIKAHILGYREIVKLCNLFGNPQQAPYDAETKELIQERVSIL